MVGIVGLLKLAHAAGYKQNPASEICTEYEQIVAEGNRPIVKGTTNPMSDEFDARSKAVKLLKSCNSAALATLGEDAAPFASLVSISSSGGEPILLLSDLAVHTGNLRQRSSASLLLVEAETTDDADPLMRTRLTLTGKITVCTDQSHAAGQFLRDHPRAATYAGFADFAFYQMTTSGAHIVAGFGRIASIEVDRLFAQTDG